MTAHSESARRTTRIRLLTLGVAGALLGFLLVSQFASGYGVNYCANWIWPGATCEGPNHTLTANIAYDDTGSFGFVCESATDSSGRFVSGWGCGFGYAETCYPGNQLLRGWIANAAPYWLYMNGSDNYGQGCP
jgi:hypothetical protein